MNQETSSVLGLTTHTFYKRIAHGELDSYKVGNARRITREALERLRSGGRQRNAHAPITTSQSIAQ